VIEQGVAVRSGSGNMFGADSRAAAGTIVHYRLLSETFAEILGHDATDDVIATTGRVGDHHAHGARRIGSGLGRSLD